jgi:hypothetical protein
MDEALAKMVDAIAKQDHLGSKHTRKRIEQELLEALLWSRTTDSLEQLVRNVVRTLGEESKPFRAFIPFSGLSFQEGVTIDFGGIIARTYNESADFEKTFHEPFQELLRYHAPSGWMLVNALWRNPAKTIHQLRQVRKDDKQFMHYLTAFKWRPSVCIDIEGGLTKVQDTVFARVQGIADYLQFCVGLFYGDDSWRPLVDYHFSALARGMQVYPIVAKDGSVMDFPTLPSTAPAMFFGQQHLKVLNEEKLLAVAPIFATAGADVGNGFDALLRRSVEMFAEGDRARSARQRLLSYAAATEVFFTRRKDTAVAVCHGMARVLSWVKADRFQKHYETCWRLYDVRSRAVHDGLIPSGNDVQLYRHIAQNIIRSFVQTRGQFADKAAIEAWSAPPEPKSLDEG